MSYDKSAEDVVTNLSNNPSIYDVVDTALENPVRRRLIAAGASGAAALSFLSLTGCGDSNSSNPAPTTPASTPTTPPVGKATALGFSAVPKSLADVVSVPAGYQVSVLFRLGDPMTASTPEYLNDGTDSGASFANRAGDHHDGMHFFGMNAAGAYDPNASDRGLLCMNHEAITPAFLHPNGPTIVNGARTVNEEVIKELNVHGVSVIEVRRTGNSWSYVRNSTFNRRITTNTDMILSGPAARSPQMITQYSPDGSRTRGTVNNCAHGYTPWGTYLTCEENYAGYFRRVAAVDNPNRTPKELVSFARNGVAGNGREGWATAVAADPTDTTFSRWITEKRGASAVGRDDFRNVSNTYGWNVEIDPFNPSSTPKKRTAMGRFAHEGAWPARVVAGQPLVWYMGDDSRGEYIYKYVSNAVWDPADATRGMAAGDKYLDDGKLYVARFNADGLGEWLELRLGVGNITSANTTYAFESQADVLINTRLAADALGATRMDRPEWGAVDPFNGNVYMTLTNNNSTIRTLANADAANPRFYNDPRTTGTAQRGNPNGHIIRWAEINSNPAAVAFSWDIFLFGSRSTSDTRTVNLSKECEITGIIETPDGRTLFVNIQHPGEDTTPNFTTRTYGSNWPDGGNARPRSATIVVTRTDGGVIGV
jgi:secreted PhoX family phosphatase